jgi:phosphatidylglycerophosphate synthase
MLRFTPGMTNPYGSAESRMTPFKSILIGASSNVGGLCANASEGTHEFMTRIQRLRNIIFAVGLAYLVIAPVMLTLWERSWLTAVFVYGGMAFLIISCAVYFYGFLFWKGR